MLVWIFNPFDNLPEEGVRRQRYALLCRAFVQLGHEVVWWTSDFRHQTKSYRTLPREYVNPDGVRVRLVHAPRYTRNVSLRRFWSHRILAKNWWREAQKETRGPDLVITSIPPLSTAATARKIRSLWNCRIAIDIQDAWPEVFYQLVPKIFRRLHLFLPLDIEAEKALRCADAVGCVGRSYRDWAMRFNKRVHLAWHGIELPPSSPERPDGVRLAYVGNMGPSYDLRTLVRAAIKENIPLELAGSGPDEEELRELAAGHANIRFLGFLGDAQLRGMLARATVSVVPMKAASGVAVPYKLADYAAAGLGVVCSLPGESRELLEKYHAGVFYREGDVDALLAAIHSLTADAGRNARRMAEECFDAESSYPALARFFAESKHIYRPRRQGFGKRFCDVLLVLLALPVWGTLFCITALAALAIQGRPLFFRQERPGLFGKPFRLIKFRSMKEGLGSDEERLTRFGKFLRAASLDELPELINVLKGELSLVGPRPLLMRYLPLYSPEQSRRHDVLPGLTGWAVVHGRNAIDWKRKFQLDAWYAENHGFWLDLRILLRTVLLVISHKGISADGNATMPEFTGES